LTLPYSGSAKQYIYSDIEIQALLEAALALKPANKLRCWTYHCLFGLLPVTGLRISEALTLKRQDVDLEHGILTVRDTKFGKSRYVPIHESTQRILVEYDHRRNELVCYRSMFILYFYACPVKLVCVPKAQAQGHGSMILGIPLR
jgi:integrase